MQDTSAAQHGLTLRLFPVIVAGLAGGLIEVAWILSYSSMTSASAAEVARQITYSVLPYSMNAGSAALLGVGIHLLLSIALAAGFVTLLYGPVARRFGATGVFFSGLATLSAVWAVNFLILLPALNPAFPALMPYAVTLTSKLLFGAAMSWVLLKSPEMQRQLSTSLPSI
ncbi:MAG: hypothetical protein P8126_05935 [Gammaproteobacteria bacterium]|jgi:hypothetical protein